MTVEEIVNEEFERGLIPLKIIRYRSDGGFEIWSLNELIDKNV